MSKHCITYITTPTEVAERIATTLVGEELAVCVNIIEDIKSVYRWEGKVEVGHESLLMAKSVAENVEALIEKVRDIHPYEVPEIVSTDITYGNQDYLDYLSGKEVVVEELDDLDEFDEEEAGSDDEVEAEEDKAEIEE